MSIRAFCIAGVLIAISVSASDLKPGIDRWAVKTTVLPDKFKSLVLRGPMRRSVDKGCDVEATGNHSLRIPAINQKIHSFDQRAEFGIGFSI